MNPSKEIVPRGANSNFIEKQVRELARRNLDINLIFHAHGTPENAIESTSDIEPNSVVFLEGYNLDANSEIIPLANVFEELNHLHRNLGTSSEAYQTYKAALLSDITARQNTPPENALDFKPYTYKEWQILLEKDCYIHMGDLRANSTSSNSSQLQDFYQRVKLASEATASLLPDTHRGIGKALKQFKQSIIHDRSFHDDREMSTVMRTMLISGYYIWKGEPQKDINVTDEGKIKTYVKFGTAHAKSLTQKFIENGFTPNVSVVEPIRESKYFDASPEDFHHNFRRRVGFNAINHLLIDYFDLDEARTIGDELYERLAVLNEDDEEALKFSVRCLQVKQKQDQNDNEAYSMLKSLLRDFTREPAKFV